MKKRRILSILALVLCLSLLFVSCKKNNEDAEETTEPTYSEPAPEKSFMEKIFNSDIENVSKALSTLTYLDDVKGTPSQMGNMILFTDNSGTNTVYKVFSAYTKSVVKTFEDTDTLKHRITELSLTIYRYENDSSSSYQKALNNAFIVKTFLPDDTNVIKNTCLYNAKGELLASVEGNADPEAYQNSANNSSWFIFDEVLWSSNTDDGSLEKLADVPKYMNLPQITDYNDSYYYNLTQSTVKVYDKQFKLIYEWSLPSYAKYTYYSMNILNNGNIVAQYSVILPEDALEYDYVIDTDKIDLVTVILSPAEGTSTDHDVDFLIQSVSAAHINSTTDESILADGIENIATVYYIQDERLDTSATAQDKIVLSNDLETGDSVKLIPAQQSIPAYYGNGYYMTFRNNNIVILDKDGKLVSEYSQYPFGYSFDKYTVLAGDGIYNIYTMEKVYDLEANNASVVKAFNKSAIILTENEENNTSAAYLFVDGETKLISTSKDEVIKDASGKEISGIDFGNGYYYIKNTDGIYDYYNEKGEKILSTEHYLSSSYYFDIYGKELYTISFMFDTVGGKYCYFS